MPYKNDMYVYMPLEPLSINQENLIMLDKILHATFEAPYLSFVFITQYKHFLYIFFLGALIQVTHKYPSFIDKQRPFKSRSLKYASKMRHIFQWR